MHSFGLFSNAKIVENKGRKLQVENVISNRLMKIAIASTFHPYRGGIAQFNDAMATALKTKGHTVNCFNWSRQYPSLLFPGVAQTKSGTSTPPRSSSAPLDSISPNSWRKTAKVILAEGDIDLVILPFWHSALAPALRGVAKSIKRLAPDTKVITIMHNATSHDGKASDKWLTRRFLKRVDSVITLSDSVTQEVEVLAPSLPITTLFHPLYNDLSEEIDKNIAREKLGIPIKAKNVVLFFGLIRPYKGLDILLEAANSFCKDTHLIVAGECYGPWNKYEKLISENISQDRIHVFNKFIPDEELGTYFGAADLVALPYLSASQSGVTATAIHYNLPIIASNVGDLSGSILENKTGTLVKAGDATELSEAIKLWFNEKHEGLEEAYAELKAAKSWEEFASQILHIND